MVLPCFYNAPISFYALLVASGVNFTVEICDNYTKQTYRNRCRILGANGVIDLVIPIIKVHGKKTLMKDTRIDYSTNWNKTHWKSISSAYSSSPFFEFMEDSFYPFYNKMYEYLYDLNLELINQTLELIELDISYKTTESYTKKYGNEDAREAIHPKHSFSYQGYKFRNINYQQVFSERHDFIPDLSIIDLLFNEGPNSIRILKDTI